MDVAKNLSWNYHPGTAGAARMGFPKHYDASSGLPVKLFESSDSFVVKLGGLKADTITSAIQFINKSRNFGRCTCSDPLIQLWETAFPFLPEAKTLRDWIVSWVMVTTAEQHLLGGRTTEQALKDGAAYLCNVLSTNEHDQSYHTYDQEVIGSLRELSTGGDAEIYAALASNFCLNRKFIVTHEGRMGIGPTGTEPGDMVFVHFGGRVLYILRRQDSAFLLVGDSYVHGLVGDEAVQAWQRGELTEEVVELQ